MEKVLEYIAKNHEPFLDSLKELLKQESISANPEKKAEVLKTADFEVAKLKELGFENVQQIPTAGYPIVYGEWLGAPGKPTVMIYGHYDVQPPDPLEEWETPPFDPQVREGWLYARGANDNKGQHWTHICALEAHLKATGSLPINVKIFLEGEEEVGSVNTVPALEKHKDLFNCDAVLVSDTSWYDTEHPALCISLRGLCYFEVELTGPARDLHSGTYGGMVRNPINAMAHIIAKLQDEAGHILIPNYYDKVLPIGDEDRKLIEKLPTDADVMAKEIGAPALAPEEGFSHIESNWLRPSLDVNGIWGGYQGAGAKTVIASKCGFKVSSRIVANQDPKEIEKLLHNYIQSVCPSGVTCKVKTHSVAPALNLDINNAFIEKTMSAYSKGYNRDVVLIRDGASIPIMSDFNRILKVPILIMGVGLHEDRIHSPNERFRMENFYGGILGAAHAYTAYSDIAL